MMQSSSHSSQQIVVFGQRGVGKTTFIERLKSYWKNDSYVFLDLDQEIERKLGVSVATIFARQGEAAFRKHEKEIFFQILSDFPRLVLTVGGGFPVSEIPLGVHALWLQRLSDRTGRIFLDRPRLNPTQTDLEEFFQRAKVRETLFSQRADEIYLMPEGLKNCNVYEELLFSKDVEFVEAGYLTILDSLSRQINFLKRIRNFGFEYRDDLIKFEDYLHIVNECGLTKMILSFRDPQKIQQTEAYFSEFLKKTKMSQDVLVDWALELGDLKQLQSIRSNILSLHEYLPGENLSSFLKRLESFSKNGLQLKASPMIESFSDLEVLWSWQQQDPANRSVLPRSKNGRWIWFRQIMKGHQKINFWKVAQGSAKDQPTFYQWVSTREQTKKFAAVLGAPIELSRSPVEQQAFFDQFQWPVLAIDLQESEFDLAMPFLEKLGLKAAAVTSPLKRKAFHIVDSDKLSRNMMSPLCQELASINTLFIASPPSDAKYFGTNTDLAGFEGLVQTLMNQNLSVLVWGGGGTLPVIKKVFPHAIEYSVRTGLARKASHELLAPDVLIWAAAPNAKSPSLVKAPKYVVDLNYREDSLARSFARSSNAIYISGEKMFLTQAEKQREFWQTVV